MTMKKPKKKKTILKNRTLVIITAVLLVCIVAVVLFFNSNPKSSQKTTSPESQDSQAVEQQRYNSEQKKETKGTVITTGDSEFGAMLFNDQGQAIYIWELEESTKAECYGDCAEAWPPVLTDGAPRATGSVNSDLLGTTKRTDGSTQVTYNGHPLYYYAHEEPGEVECHNIRTHGGLWWVIHPNGIRAD